MRAIRNNVRQFNGEWLRIRVAIPSDYQCDATINDPTRFAGSCWWGIKYVFEGDASDTTTWSTSIEGYPVHLTE